MAILHVEEMRDMTPAEREAELEELRTELLNTRAVQAAGGAPENPGRIGELRRTVARLKTIRREEGDLAEETGDAAGGGA
jgi:large subunit ribosomal protein L29